MTGRTRITLLAGLLLFSAWSVYTRYVDLHNFDLVTNLSFRDLSMSQYNDTIAGVRTFPYQWRVLGFWIARAGTMIAPVDPHVIDVGVKTISLAASAALLYMFSTTLVSSLGAVLAAVMYLFVTAAAFSSEGYAIYFTNDYLAILSWFAGVVALRHKHWWLAALAAFAGAWAKETAMLIVFLAGFEALRRRAPWSAPIACGIAFAIPTLLLRTIYPAPLAQWAWWDTFRMNVPFIVWDPAVIAKSLRDNLKVLLFFNVLLVFAWRAWRRAQDSFIVSLGLTLACYVVLAWMVVYIRELRHMLPFTILVIPLAVAELERGLAPRSP
ncbi:MAG TPA: hypothetical protein VM096_11240 [Vicinamibacterales bacterium]|nr:hypothetical protein [Vicinamibacterales bacterium]